MRRIFHTNGIMHRSSDGFTLVELIISISLSAIVLIVFIGTIADVYFNSARAQAELELTGENKLAVSQLERDIRYSSGYNTSIASPISDSNAPSGGWTHKGTPSDVNKRTLILKAYTTSNNPYATTRTPVYVDGTQTNPYNSPDPILNCSTTPPLGTLYFNPKLPFYVIYFVSGTNLYRRILTDTTTATCNSATIYQKQSCPTGTGGACMARDELVASDVAQFSVDYYKQDVQEDTSTGKRELVFTLIDVYAATNPVDIATADNVTVTVKLQRTIRNKPVDSTLSITVSRINQ